MNENVKVVATNRKARHDYQIYDTFEAGIALQGSEIKSIRAGQINLKEGYVVIERRQAWLMNTHISVYEQANRQNHEPLRKRKLLLHKKEIAKLYDAIMQKGMTIIPLRVYLKKGLAKVEVASAKGLKKYDKRQKIAKREAEMQMRRVINRRG
jgi:SsrA-binding protein